MNKRIHVDLRCYSKKRDERSQVNVLDQKAASQHNLE